jgi:hypothetical protein
MPTESQIQTIRQLAIKCIVLPDCPVKKEHAKAARILMEREVIKLIDNAIGDSRRMAADAGEQSG